MDQYAQLINRIIDNQKAIIGPLAVELAGQIQGIKINNPNGINIEGNPKEIVGNLVLEYEKLFGQASIEVCRDAVREVKPHIPSEQLPDILH